MRLFEYKCPKCGKIFEEMVKNYNDEVKCPVCGKSLLQKKGRGAKVYCSNPDCTYERPVEKK